MRATPTAQGRALRHEERLTGDGLRDGWHPPQADKGGAMEHPRGEGGPTGCKEAFLTVMGDDGFLAGVLLLLHTVRKCASPRTDPPPAASSRSEVGSSDDGYHTRRRTLEDLLALAI